MEPRPPATKLKPWLSTIATLLGIFLIGANGFIAPQIMGRVVTAYFSYSAEYAINMQDIGNYLLVMLILRIPVLLSIAAGAVFLLALGSRVVKRNALPVLVLGVIAGTASVILTIMSLIGSNLYADRIAADKFFSSSWDLFLLFPVAFDAAMAVAMIITVLMAWHGLQLLKRSTQV